MEFETISLFFFSIKREMEKDYENREKKILKKIKSEVNKKRNGER